MSVYHLSENRLEQWKAWFTINGVPTRNIVRGKDVKILAREIEAIEFYVNDAGARIVHECSCETGGTHLAKVVTRYPLIQEPGLWAEADLISDEATA